MTTEDRIEKTLAHFARTTDQFFSKDEFRALLASGRKLRIKYGVDVTAPTLHIGHAVNLWLLRYLQGLGHKVIFLIGDFTTRIGDPDGRQDARPVIPREEIDKNAEAFIRQAKMVLRFDDPALLEIRRNSEWLEKLSLQDFLNLSAQVTHARLISRDMFQKRIVDEREIYMHEMLYPVLQGYDSVAIHSDMTIIGSDQLFNEMMGRFFQEKEGQKPQVILTTKITAGIDGKAKQSKSIGNYIGLGHTPRDKFGRVMSIPDALIDEYFRVYTDLPLEDIDKLQGEIKTKPRDAKIKLAYAIVGRYHGHEIAVWEREWFEHTVSKGLVPDDIPTLPVAMPRIDLIDLVTLTRPGKSRGDTRRLIVQGGVELNGEKKTDPAESLNVRTNDVLKVGKRNWYRIEIVHLNEMETERLYLKPLQVEDVDLIQQHLPEWEIVKYLGGRVPSRAAAEVAREVFKRVIMQPDPKTEWLWKITAKDDPEKIIGVAHLRDPRHGDQNIWIAPQYQPEFLLEEAMMAVNEHAFAHLGFDSVLFRTAFAHASAPQEMEALRRRFMTIDKGMLNRDAPDGAWGFTRDGWEKMKEWWLHNKPQVQSTPVRRKRAGDKLNLAARNQKAEAAKAPVPKLPVPKSTAPKPPVPELPVPQATADVALPPPAEKPKPPGPELPRPKPKGTK